MARWMWLLVLPLLEAPWLPEVFQLPILLLGLLKNS